MALSFIKVANLIAPPPSLLRAPTMLSVLLAGLGMAGTTRGADATSRARSTA